MQIEGRRLSLAYSSWIILQSRRKLYHDCYTMSTSCDRWGGLSDEYNEIILEYHFKGDVLKALIRRVLPFPTSFPEQRLVQRIPVLL
jgi:hypothetical protein